MPSQSAEFFFASRCWPPGDRAEVEGRVLVLDRHEADALRAGVVGAEEIGRWHSDLERVQEAGVFYCSVTGATVAGRRAALTV